MSHTATLRIPCKDAASARAAAAALGPDNGNFAKATADGDVVVVEAASDTPMGLLRTLDDIIECLRATGLT